MELNLEEERKRLVRYEEWHKAQRMNYPELLQQRKLVSALEQLEQAREALDAIRMHPAVRNSFAGRQIIELAEQVLEQQEVG